MSAQIVDFKRGTGTCKKLVYDGYFFVKYSLKNGIQQWRCDFFRTKDGSCSAKVWTNAQNRVIKASQHSFVHAKTLELNKIGQSKENNKDSEIAQLKAEIEALKSVKKENEALKNFIKSKNLIIPSDLVASNEGIEAHSQEQQFAKMPSSSAGTDDPIFAELGLEPMDILQLEFDQEFQQLALGIGEELEETPQQDPEDDQVNEKYLKNVLKQAQNEDDDDA